MSTDVEPGVSAPLPSTEAAVGIPWSYPEEVTEEFYPEAPDLAAERAGNAGF